MFYNLKSITFVSLINNQNNITTMEITLKNVKFYERMSEETNAFNADVYINGKKVFYAKNDGHGGETNIQMYKRDDLLLTEVENYCKSLPPTKSEALNFEYTPDLESVVDDLVYNWIIQKDIEKQKKKLNKDMLVGIVYQKPNMKEYDYALFYWGKHTIEQLLAVPKYKEIVMKKKDELIAKGNKVLNTNL